MIKRLILPTCLILLAGTHSVPQPVKSLVKSTDFHHFADPGATVKTVTVDHGVAHTINAIALKDVQLPVNQKTTVRYDSKILRVDSNLFGRLVGAGSPKLVIRNFHMVPEFHVDARDPTAAPISYQIFFSQSQPFRYVDSIKKFTTELEFFLFAASGNNKASLPEPVAIEIASDDIPSVIPSHLSISHLSIPSSKVDLSAEQLDDSASVKIITASNPEGYATFLKVKPSLEIFTNRSSLEGWGIQKIPIQVRFLGSRSGDSERVIFTVGKGSVNPNILYVKYNSPSTVYLSSEGTGATILSAATSSLQSNNIDFTYTFPWPFLLASLLGGLCGGLGRYFYKEKGNGPLVKLMVGAILIGLIGALAYYMLGINLLGLSFSTIGLTEFAVAALSALFAYFGLGVFDELGIF